MSATYIISPASGDQYASVFSTTSLSSVLGTLHKGTAITVLGTTGNYYKIKYDGGSSSAVTGMTCTSNYCASGCSGPGLICGGTSRNGVPTGCNGSCGITCSTGCYRESNCTGLASVILFNTK